MVLRFVLATLFVAAGGAGVPPSALSTQAPGGPQQSPEAAEKLPSALNEALALASDGDLAGAIGVLEALGAENDPPEAALAALGGLYVEAGHFERALGILGPLGDREPADPAVLYNAGRAAEGLGRFQAADGYYRRSLAILPRSPALRALGMLIGRLGRPEAAYEYLTPWIATNPADHEARIAAAAGAIALERTPEAEALLEGTPSDDPGVKLLRAQILLQRADPWGAINELQEFEAEPPAAIDRAVRRTLARAYLVVGRAGEALTLMEPLESGRREDAVILADAYFQTGQIDDAIETLSQYAEPLTSNSGAGEPTPLAGHIALEYGRYLHVAGEAARAVPFLRLATQLDPDTPAAFQALGQALAATGEREKARDALERFDALSTRTTNEVANLDRQKRDLDDPTGREVRRALELSASGDVEGALERLRREARLAPNDPRPAYAASSVLLHAGRPADALTAADQALVVSPGAADGLYQRGAVLMALRRLTEAEDMFREALKAQPRHIATLSDYAVLLMSGGRTEEAGRLFEKVLELRPGNALARQQLEQLRRKEQPDQAPPR